MKLLNQKEFAKYLALNESDNNTEDLKTLIQYNIEKGFAPDLKLDKALGANNWILDSKDGLIGFADLLKATPEYARYVRDIILCDFNAQNLQSLEGLPEKIEGSFDLQYTAISSLKGCPKYIGGNFTLKNNSKLTSIEGAPDRIQGQLITDLSPELLKQLLKRTIVKGTVVNVTESKYKNITTDIPSNIAQTVRDCTVDGEVDAHNLVNTIIKDHKDFMEDNKLTAYEYKDTKANSTKWKKFVTIPTIVDIARKYKINFDYFSSHSFLKADDGDYVDYTLLKRGMPIGDINIFDDAILSSGIDFDITK